MNIYEDIAKRTNGEIYVGVVGPVRSGKSTFVKKFIDNVVIPNIAGDYDKERAKDETPQSASGRTIMTTEPKFVPDEAVSVRIGSSEMKVRLIDCVGYMVDGAIGGEENGESRMVMTPWSSEPMEFNTAAELGTKKVISDHSTVGIVVTTDGTIGDIPRESFVPAEERVVNELKSLNKPFVIILNSSNPNSKLTHDLAISLEEKYNAPVALVNALELGNQDFEGIFELILGQFGINELRFNLPKYFASLDRSHWLKESIIASIKSSLSNATKIDNIKDIVKDIAKNENVLGIPEITNDLGSGRVYVKIDFQPYLYYKVISELCGIEINDDENLFKTIESLGAVKVEFDKFSKAIEDVTRNGYGIVLPNVEDMTLEEPEIVKQAGAYGVKLKASAPSIHMIKTSINTEINPIVGTEERSQEMIKYILDEFEDDPKKIWQSNMFGKTLYALVNDGLHSKLEHFSKESQLKLSDTLSRVINEGSNGLICIIL